MKEINGVQVWNTVEDLTGKKFGKLTAKYITGKNKDRSTVWFCECECGGNKEVPSTRLKRLITTSCGCLWKPRPGLRKYVGELSGQYWSSVRSSAKLRGLEFSITKEYAWELFLKQNKKCIYTGEVLSLERPDYAREKQTASLDRIDSNKGYIKGNIQWVHKDVQRMKNAFSHDRFLEVAKLIYFNHFRDK